MIDQFKTKHLNKDTGVWEVPVIGEKYWCNDCGDNTMAYFGDQSEGSVIDTEVDEILQRHVIVTDAAILHEFIDGDVVKRRISDNKIIINNKVGDIVKGWVNYHRIGE